MVIISSAAGTPSPLCVSTGIPLPLSLTVIDSSLLIIMSILEQCPAIASSMQLSTTSNIIWCRPEPSSVSPIYMPGLFLTASRPFRT